MIIEMIESKIDDFSPNERKLVRYIIENPKEVEINTLAQLTLKAKVSSGTVMRFTKKIGFNGYSEFRYSLINDLRSQHTKNQNSKEDRLVSAYIDSLNELKIKNKFLIQEFAARIVQNRKVNIIGHGNSSLPAIKLKYDLFKFGIIVNVIDNPILSKDLMIDKDDLNIIFSESGKNYGVGKFLVNNSTSVLLVTCNSDYANEKCLFFEYSNVVNFSVDPHIIMLVIADMFYLEIIKHFKG